MTLTLPQTGAADTFCCSLTGYTFMGGGSAYVSVPSGPAAQKDYFLAQPLNYSLMGPGTNYWGYGWVKFDVGDEAVASARLYFDLLGVGSMSVTPATPDNPASLEIYDPLDIDAADLAGDAALRAALRDNLDASTPLYSVSITSNGACWVDITDIYNNWAAGAVENNGLIFSAPDEDAGGKYAGFGNSSGGAPYISTTAVPEPDALVLAAAALIGLGFARILRRGGSASRRSACS